MEKYRTIHQNKQELEQFYSAEKFEYKEEDYWIKQIESLKRYRNEWGYIEENNEGEYIKLEDVLSIFSREKEK